MHFDHINKMLPEKPECIFVRYLITFLQSTTGGARNYYILQNHCDKAFSRAGKFHYFSIHP